MTSVGDSQVTLVGDLDEIRDSWVQFGPVPVIEAICGMNQQTEDLSLSLCLSLCLLNK